MMAKKITRELFLSFPYIVLVQDKVLFTQIPASSSSLLLSWWRGVCPVGEVVQVIPATFVETTYHGIATNQNRNDIMLKLRKMVGWGTV